MTLKVPKNVGIQRVRAAVRAQEVIQRVARGKPTAVHNNVLLLFQN